MTPPVKAALLSGLVWPGAGQIYNRRYASGVLFALATLGAAGYLLFVVNRAVQAVALAASGDPLELFGALRDALSKEQVTLLGVQFSILVLWALSVVHAYLGARVSSRA